MADTGRRDEEEKPAVRPKAVPHKARKNLPKPKKPGQGSATKHTEPNKGTNHQHNPVSQETNVPGKQLEVTQPTPESSVDTAEPSVNTAEPSANTAEPSANTAEPSANTAEPSANTAEPSASTAEPSANTAEPSVNTAEPNVDRSEPNVDTAEQSVDTAKPSFDTAKRSIDTAEPSANTAEPSANTAEPSANTAEPSADTAEHSDRIKQETNEKHEVVTQGTCASNLQLDVRPTTPEKATGHNEKLSKTESDLDTARRDGGLDTATTEEEEDVSQEDNAEDLVVDESQRTPENASEDNKEMLDATVSDIDGLGAETNIQEELTSVKSTIESLSVHASQTNEDNKDTSAGTEAEAGTAGCIDGLDNPTTNDEDVVSREARADGLMSDTSRTEAENAEDNDSMTRKQNEHTEDYTHAIKEELLQKKAEVSKKEKDDLKVEIDRQLHEIRDEFTRALKTQEESMQKETEDLKKEKEDLKAEMNRLLNELKDQSTGAKKTQEDKLKVKEKEAEDLKKEKDGLKGELQELLLKEVQDQMKKQFDEFEKRFSDREAQDQEGSDRQNRQSDVVQELRQQLDELKTRFTDTETQRQVTHAQQNKQMLELLFKEMQEQIKKKFSEIEMRFSVREAQIHEGGDQQDGQLSTTVAEMYSELHRRCDVQQAVYVMEQEFAGKESELQKCEDRLLKALSQAAEDTKKSIGTKLEELRTIGEYLITTKCKQIKEKIGKIKKTHKQQLERLSNRISKCEKEHADVKEFVNAKVTEAADSLKENQNTMMAVLDSQLVEMREQIECQDTMMKQIDGQLGDVINQKECQEAMMKQIDGQLVEMSNRGKYQEGLIGQMFGQLQEVKNQNENQDATTRDIYDQLEKMGHQNEEQDKLLEDISGQLEEIRIQKVDGDQLQRHVTKQLTESLKKYDDNCNMKLQKTLEQLKANIIKYADEKNSAIQADLTKLKHNTDYIIGDNRKHAEEEMQKIRENYKRVSDRVCDLERSRESIHETVKQEFAMIGIRIEDLKKETSDNVDEKSKELQRRVDGGLLEQSALHNRYTDYFSKIEHHLNCMEKKQHTMDCKLEDTLRHQQELLQHLNQLEDKKHQRDAELSQEGTVKLNELRAEVNGQMVNLRAFMEALNQNLVNASFKLQMIETLQNRAPIGFTARATGCHVTTRHPIMTGFSEVTCNEGGHYNPLTGLFTAPIAGIYVVNLTHTQSNEGEIFLNVVQSHRASELRTLIAYTWTYGKHSTSSDNAVVRMQEGDSLHVKVQHFSGNGQIWSPSSFSCFLIG